MHLRPLRDWIPSHNSRPQPILGEFLEARLSQSFGLGIQDGFGAWSKSFWDPARFFAVRVL